VPRARFERNPVLTVAQIAAVVQGVLVIVTGIKIIGFEDKISKLVQALTGPGSGSFPTDGVVALVIGSLLIASAVLIGRAFSAVRWLLALWEVVGFLFVLALVTAHWGIFPFSIYVIEANGGVVVDTSIVLAIQALIIYGLVIHPATYRDFAQ
jgi:hypothetical protein